MSNAVWIFQLAIIGMLSLTSLACKPRSSNSAIKAEVQETQEPKGQKLALIDLLGNQATIIIPDGDFLDAQPKPVPADADLLSIDDTSFPDPIKSAVKAELAKMGSSDETNGLALTNPSQQKQMLFLGYVTDAMLVNGNLSSTSCYTAHHALLGLGVRSYLLQAHALGLWQCWAVQYPNLARPDTHPGIARRTGCLVQAEYNIFNMCRLKAAANQFKSLYIELRDYCGRIFERKSHHGLCL